MIQHGILLCSPCFFTNYDKIYRFQYELKRLLYMSKLCPVKRLEFSLYSKFNVLHAFLSSLTNDPFAVHHGIRA